MTSDPTAGLMLIVGSVVFLAGAAVGVPGVFTEPDPQARLRLLTEHLVAWRIAQPLYGLGPLIAAAGVGWLAAAASTQATRATFAAASLALAVGALAWTRSLYLRGTRVAEFAHGTLPGWPFATYVLLTIGGLALLGVGLLAGRFPVWLGWLTLGADLLFLAGYLWFKDIPPFVFYLLLLLAGVVVAWRPGSAARTTHLPPPRPPHAGVTTSRRRNRRRSSRSPARDKAGETRSGG